VDRQLKCRTVEILAQRLALSVDVVGAGLQARPGGANKAVTSLVALYQNRVVGHILFSPITVAEAPENFRGVGLAPMSVLPEFHYPRFGFSRAKDYGLDNESDAMDGFLYGDGTPRGKSEKPSWLGEVRTRGSRC
jgi:hypothetical protein